nr:hypothetical protein [Clostridioides difficile]
MNTKYMESSTREATVTHVLNLLTSVLTRADIQSFVYYFNILTQYYSFYNFL